MDFNKLSIVLVTNNYTPYQGGVVSSIKQQMKVLQELGHSVHLITLDFNPHLPAEQQVIRIFSPVRFHYKQNPMAIPWLPTYTIQKLIKQINPDIIHTHHPFLLGNAALKVAKKNSIPIVFTYHTLYHHYLHYIPLPHQVSNLLVEKQVTFFCRSVDGIIAPSTAIKELLEQKKYTTPARIIPSAVAPIFFKKKEKSNLESPIKLLTVSRFTKEKNLYFLLDVMAILNHHNYNLTLIGYGAEYNRLQEYAYSIKRLHIDRVRFVICPPEKQLAHAYQTHDIFLFSSTTDTQGIVIGEAMASGMPVIAIDGPGQRDMIQHGINGYLVKNKQEMVNAIEYVNNNQNVFQQLQHHAYQTAQRLLPNSVINQLCDFYQEVRTKTHIY